MSQETMEWLNTMTLIGFTDKRGTAWHYRAEKQGNEPNHYPGAIPVEDVNRRLFFWVPVEGIVKVTFVNDDGVTTVDAPDHKAIVNSLNGDILGIHGEGFVIHDYREWLITNVGNILDADLQIGSAGLLHNGAQAWVQVEMPENVETPQGVTYRPYISAYTSLDGSMATGYQKGAQLIVCDNTLALSQRSASHTYKVKHTANSLGKIVDARKALEIIYKNIDETSQQIQELCNIEVSDKQFTQFLDLYVPIPGEPGRGQTMAENKRGILRRLYTSDERCTAWNGTAFGVVQTVNTYQHHYATVRGANRAVRNAEKALNGMMARHEQEALDKLELVLA